MNFFPVIDKVLYMTVLIQSICSKLSGQGAVSRAVFNWVSKVITGNYFGFGLNADKRCRSYICSHWHSDLCICQDSMCSCATRFSCSFTLSELSSSIQVSSRGTLLRGCFPSPVPPPLSTVLSMWQVPAFSFPCGGSWLGCQDLPFMGAVSIWELAVNSGNSSMHQASNFHFARQLLTTCMIWDWLITYNLIRKSLSWFWFCDHTQ